MFSVIFYSADGKSRLHQRTGGEKVYEEQQKGHKILQQAKDIKESIKTKSNHITERETYVFSRPFFTEL